MRLSRRWLNVVLLAVLLALGLILSLGCSALCRSTTFYPADKSVLPGCEVP